MNELEVLKRKYSLALQSLATSSDVIFSLDAELSIVKEQIEELRKASVQKENDKPTS